MPTHQPVRWIGLIVSLILATVATLSGQGFISAALAGQLTDLVNAAGQFILLTLPFIAAIFASRFVTPVPSDQRGL